MGTWFEELDRASDYLCQDLDRDAFVPLLEADLVAYLYHHFVLAKVPLKDIHLDTRIIGIEKLKYDLVIGPVELDLPKEQRAAVSDPQLVIQIKFFPRRGFTHQQYHVHYKHVIEGDIASFKPLRKIFPSCQCFELLGDFHRSRDLLGYLQGRDKSAQSTKIERIRAVAAEAGVSVGWLHPENPNKTRAKWWLSK
jgi:hypothetical protein